MAERKTNKKTQRAVKKAAKKAAKKYPILVFIAFLLVVVIVGCILLHRKGVIHLPFLDSLLPQQSQQSSESSSSSSSSSGEEGEMQGVPSVDYTSTQLSSEEVTHIKGSALSIHFLELGNEYTGDSTLIKVGDTEILIDAGSRQNSAGTIVPYVQQFCEDNVLEYVIATHAHQDHIAGFIGTANAAGVFESFECETIIDFPRTNNDESKTNSVYGKYKAKRDAEVEAGATHYTALECWNNENGAQRSYSLGSGVTMHILYQKFYEEKASDENDYSVCVLLTEGKNNYLFTGDLEHSGEESLVQSNDLPQCVLYKGGHHGSPTSSTEALLEKIQPEMVCVCCCCGSDEYTENVENMFPSQDFIDRIAPYTDKVYVTTIIAKNEGGYTSLNGNIVVTSNNGALTVLCSNNTTLFKDTEWFKYNRTCPEAWAS